MSDPIWKIGDTNRDRIMRFNPARTPLPVRKRLFMYFTTPITYISDSIASIRQPMLIRAHITDRDQMTDDDFVGILLDTYGTMQGGYEFFVNPYAHSI